MRTSSHSRFYIIISHTRVISYKSVWRHEKQLTHTIFLLLLFPNFPYRSPRCHYLGLPGFNWRNGLTIRRRSPHCIASKFALRQRVFKLQLVLERPSIPRTYRPTHAHAVPNHTQASHMQHLPPTTRHFKARRPTERTYAALLLQGQGKHLYKFENTRLCYTVSR
jgi:hypothetical protein